MIKGIGLDVTEIERINRSTRASSKFKNRILTIVNWSDLTNLKEARQLEFLAGRFAAKEAFAKALGLALVSVVAFRILK